MVGDLRPVVAFVTAPAAAQVVGDKLVLEFAYALQAWKRDAVDGKQISHSDLHNERHLLAPGVDRLLRGVAVGSCKSFASWALALLVETEQRWWICSGIQEVDLVFAADKEPSLSV